MAIKYIFGIDIGDGESTVSYINIRNSEGNVIQNPVIQHLQVKNNTPKVFSTVLYNNSGEAIDFGVNTGNGNSIVQAYFKRSPSFWDKSPHGFEKTYEDIMKDFIHLFMQSVLSENANPMLSGVMLDECEIYVGCPSDKLWSGNNQKEYEKLIREATGIEAVHVVPESTAAVFHMISGQENPIDLNEGLCIFDFGSSTSDFTYVKLGEAMLEASWTLGASAIEANMLQLADNKAIKDSGDKLNIWQGNYIARQLEMRKQKENWYGNHANPGWVTTSPEGVQVMVQYIPTDIDGRPKTKINKGGAEVLQLNTYCTDIDEELMKSAIDEAVLYNVSECGIAEESRTWANHCKEFLSKCHNLLENKKYSCGAVILTGGATRMGFIDELCKEIFKTAPIRDPSPSFCVAAGLCQVAINDYYLGEIESTLLIKDSQNDNAIKTAADNSIKSLKDGITESLANFCYETVIKVLTSYQQRGINNVNIQTLSNDCSNAVGTDLTQEKLQGILVQSISEFNTNSTKLIMDAAQTCAEKLYGNECSASYSLTDEMCKNSILNPTTLPLISFPPDIFHQTFLQILAILICCFPIIGNIMERLLGNFINAVNITRQLLNLQSENGKQGFLNTTKNQLQKDLLPEILRQLFGVGDNSPWEDKIIYNKLNDSLKGAFEIVALKKFKKTN